MRLLIWVGLVLVVVLLAACQPPIPEQVSISPASKGSDVATRTPTTPAVISLPPTQTSTATQTRIPASPTLTASLTATASATVVQATTTATPCGPLVCHYEGDFPLDRPIGPGGQQSADFSYRYGSTQNGERETHHGVEFVTAYGTPVLAATDGVVIVAGDDFSTRYSRWLEYYGNLVIIEHELPGVDVPVYTVYAHLSAVLTEVGTQVHTGDMIGEVGFTGSATGSHLHFEVRVGENDYESTRNPELWLRPNIIPQVGELGVLAGRIRDEYGDRIHFDGLVIEQLDEDGEGVLDTIYVETYADKYVNGSDRFDEDFAIGDLLPGWYRIRFVAHGLQSHLVEVLPGKITFFNFEPEREGG